MEKYWFSKKVLLCRRACLAKNNPQSAPLSVKRQKLVSKKMIREATSIFCASIWKKFEKHPFKYIITKVFQEIARSFVFPEYLPERKWVNNLRHFAKIVRNNLLEDRSM